jgi:putative sigma-54 modulation protein
MNIVVNGRNLEITPALKTYAEDKIGKFDRYLSNITEAVVTLSIQKYRHKAEVLLKANGMMIQAEGVTGEIYSSIDEVVEKLQRQVKKLKGKSRSSRKGEGKAKAAPPSEAPREEAGSVIKRKRFAMKPMTPEEAAMQLELSDMSFFVFNNDQSGEINVIYRRNDGDLGLIEPAK